MGTIAASSISVRVTQVDIQPILADRTELMSLKALRGI